MAEFHTRTKKKSEGWADFGEDLRVLADRAFPTLGADARQLLALQQYLTQLDDPQVAFAVKQRHPTTVEAAVSITLELESYLLPKQRVARVEEAPVDHLGIKQDALLETMSTILDRLERLETQTSVTLRNNQPKAKEASTPIVCYKCGKEGHYARGCQPKRSCRETGRPSAVGARVPRVNQKHLNVSHRDNCISTVFGYRNFLYRTTITMEQFSFVIDTDQPSLSTIGTFDGSPDGPPLSKQPDIC